MDGDETWPHMWSVSSDEVDESRMEWFTCTCGLDGGRRDPLGSQSWTGLWHELADHLIEVGQLTPEQAGIDASAGYAAPAPLTNPLWAFRADFTPAQRRQARLEFGIELPH